MIAVAWITPVSDLSNYSLMPLFVVWIVVFAIGVRRLRSVSVDSTVAVLRRRTGRTQPAR